MSALTWVNLVVSIIIFIAAGLAIYSHMADVNKLKSNENKIKSALNIFKDKNKNTTALLSFRDTQADETIALRLLYNINIGSQLPVYQLEGDYVHLILKSRHGANHRVWLGGLEIPLATGAQSQLSQSEFIALVFGEEQECRNYMQFIVLGNTLYPVQINGKPITTWFAKQQAFSGLTQISFRPANSKEKRYLYPKGSRSLVIALASILPFIALWSQLKLITLAIATTLLFTALFWPRKRPNIDDITQTNLTLEPIPTRFGSARSCRIVGTNTKFPIPRQLAKILLDKGCINGSFEIFFKPSLWKRSGTLVSANLFDNQYRLNSHSSIRLCAATHYPIYIAMTLGLVFAISTVVQYNTSSHYFPTIITSAINGPRKLTTPEDSTHVQLGELVTFNKLPMYYSSGDMTPIHSPNDFFKFVKNSEPYQTLKDQINTFSQQLDATIDYRKGDITQLLYDIRRLDVSARNIKCKDNKKMQLFFESFADKYAYLPDYNGNDAAVSFLRSRRNKPARIYAHFAKQSDDFCRIQDTRYKMITWLIASELGQIHSDFTALGFGGFSFAKKFNTTYPSFSFRSVFLENDSHYGSIQPYYSPQEWQENFNIINVSDYGDTYLQQVLINELTKNSSWREEINNQKYDDDIIETTTNNGITPNTEEVKPSCCEKFVIINNDYFVRSLSTNTDNQKTVYLESKNRYFQILLSAFYSFSLLVLSLLLIFLNRCFTISR